MLRVVSMRLEKRSRENFWVLLQSTCHVQCSIRAGPRHFIEPYYASSMPDQLQIRVISYPRFTEGDRNSGQTLLYFTIQHHNNWYQSHFIERLKIMIPR